MSILKGFIKYKIIILWIFCHTPLVLKAAEVVLSGFKTTTKGSGDWNIKIRSYDITVTRLPGESVDEILPEQQENSVKLRYEPSPQTTNTSCRIRSLPSGVTIDPVSVRVSQISSYATVGGTRISGSYSYMDDITYDIVDGTYTESSAVRRIIVPSSLADGSYDFTLTVTRDGSSSNAYRTLDIITVPAITVEDIDFGQIMFGETGGIVTERGRIELQGGTPDAAINMYLSSDVVDLTKVGGGGPTIPVNVRIYPQLNQLDSSGGGSTYLEASVDTSGDAEDGNYYGDVVVNVEYN